MSAAVSRTAERLYSAADPSNAAAATVAGYVAAMRITRDCGGFPVITPVQQAAMSVLGQAGIRRVEDWVNMSWNAIEAAA
ncbi:hypothetical protein A5666_00095 [Mycolicibacterium fortuitum]|uniref:hypothetical protein n=1 Tax=Mycolicibacterium fortuitum TaxID=1766 RepID=UPI0007E984C2|nr:hypothetical protein [Mycolicibacterium fortuitum]OBA92978.1 hypothetical protein A5665_10735 [Mycolicibacterium fortuitum]OBI66927.1 hypothetical protein A5666_00095 [Mycolicibacterium fortuitum]